jgi:hypothetical protein
MGPASVYFTVLGKVKVMRSQRIRNAAFVKTLLGELRIYWMQA